MHTYTPSNLRPYKWAVGIVWLPLGEEATGLSKVKARLQECFWSSGTPPPKRPPRAEKS